MFRMDRAAFNGLLLQVYTTAMSKNVVADACVFAQIENRIKSTQEMAVRSSGSSVSPIAKLALTLRWLAGASYLDLGVLFGVHQGTVKLGRATLREKVCQ